MMLLLFLSSFPLASPSPTLQKSHHRSNSHHPPRQLPDAPEPWPKDPSPWPKNLLNPAWPDTWPPISLAPLSPWNDNARAHLVDNFSPPQHTICAGYLSCAHCPLDPRCVHPLSIHPPPENRSPSPPPACPLRKCSETTTPTDPSACGPGALCKHSYCACPPGRKGLAMGASDASGVRGWTWPETAIVYVDPGVGCTLGCDTLGCGEVKRGRGCGTLEAPVPEGVKGKGGRGKGTGMGTVVVGAEADSGVELETPSVDHVDGSRPEWTGRPVVPTRSAVPTRSTALDDIALPFQPGGLGAIQKPGVPVEEGVDVPLYSGRPSSTSPSLSPSPSSNENENKNPDELHEPMYTGGVDVPLYSERPLPSPSSNEDEDEDEDENPDEADVPLYSGGPSPSNENTDGADAPLYSGRPYPYPSSPSNENEDKNPDDVHEPLYSEMPLPPQPLSSPSPPSPPNENEDKNPDEVDVPLYSGGPLPSSSEDEKDGPLYSGRPLKEDEKEDKHPDEVDVPLYSGGPSSPSNENEDMNPDDVDVPPNENEMENDNEDKDPDERPSSPSNDNDNENWDYVAGVADPTSVGEDN